MTKTDQWIWGILAIVAVVISASIGLYVGGWLLFIGGVVQIVNTIKADVNGIQIGIGLIKIAVAPAIGWLAFTLTALPINIFITKKMR
jgi:uncharacterized membrane protein HdeD (DUF308 family)